MITDIPSHNNIDFYFRSLIDTHHTIIPALAYSIIPSFEILYIFLFWFILWKVLLSGKQFLESEL